MERAELFIDERPHRVARLRGHEAIGTSFHYDVVCERDARGAAPRDVVGQPATILLRDRFGNERRVRGIVGSARRSFADVGLPLLEVKVVPDAAKLATSVDHRTFRDTTRAAVVARLFADAGIELRDDCLERASEEPCIAQFDESDLAFCERLWEEDGRHHWFDHDAGSTLVVSDDSRAAPFIKGVRAIRARTDDLAVHDFESVYGLVHAANAVAGTMTLLAANRDAHPEGPRQYVARAGSGAGANVIYAGSTHGQRDLSDRAQRLLEEARRGREQALAQTSSVRPYPGRAIEIGDSDVDGEYLVDDLEVEVDQLRRGTAASSETTLRVRLRLLPRGVRVRFGAGRRAPVQPGVQIAEVRTAAGREIATEQDGRVRAKLRWDRSNDDAGLPVRVAQRATADAFAIPRTGFSVLTIAERGRLDEPTSLGRLFDAEHPPPYALPGSKTRVVYKTATSPGDGTTNEIAFESAAGSEELFVHASGSLGIASNGRDTEQVDGDAAREVVGSQSAAVGADDTDGIDGHLTVRVAGNEKWIVHGARALTSEGDRAEQVGAARSLHVGKSHETSVGSKRSLGVGAASIEASLGPHATSSASRATVLVGGAKVQVAGGTVTESATVASSVVVGGAKLDLAGGSLEIEAKGAIKETVGGTMTLAADKTFSWKTERFTELAAGSASLRAADVTIEATSRILILAGGSSIRVDAEGVEIRSASITADGDSWVAEGKPHTTWRPK